MANDLWRSPPEVFNTLDMEFDFIADMASSHENALCALHYTEEDDSLSFDWATRPALQSNKLAYVYVNPPYSNPKPWILQAVKSQANGLGVVMLLNYDHSVGWFREALPYVSEIRNIVSDGQVIQGSTTGRIAFIDEDGKPKSTNSKPQTILIFNPFTIGAQKTTYVPKSYFYKETKK